MSTPAHCLTCWTAVPTSAKTCPSCGMPAPHRPEPVVQTIVPPEYRPQVRPKTVKLWPLFVGFLVLLGGCSAVVIIGGGHSAEQQDKHETPDQDGNINTTAAFSAQAVCEDFVKDRLRSPATAHFSGRSRRHVASDYISAGNVDSQNGFGATLRSHFVCTVTSTGNDQWKLVDMQLRAGGEP